MDGLLVIVSAVVVSWIALWLALRVLGAAVLRAQRALPDTALPPLRHYYNRGCDTFDRRKYLELRLTWARRDLAAATTYYKALRHALDGGTRLTLVPMREAK
jgi:hypothetical protein